MDIANILTRKGYTGWNVVNNEIVEWTSSEPQPTEAQLKLWWVEIKAEMERERIQQEREARYRMETDGLLFDALAKMVAPELAEWQAARAKIKTELPYEREVKK